MIVKEHIQDLNDVDIMIGTPFQGVYFLHHPLLCFTVFPSIFMQYLGSNVDGSGTFGLVHYPEGTSTYFLPNRLTNATLHQLLIFPE